jgi:hypothetical protein
MLRKQNKDVMEKIFLQEETSQIRRLSHGM